MHIAAEKAQLDRGRYFLALAKDCSPELHGLKSMDSRMGNAKSKVAQGSSNCRKDYPLVKEEKSRERNTLGDAIKVANRGGGW